MSEEYFDMDSYVNNEMSDKYRDTQEYLNNGETPIDYKMSSAKGAIETRQKKKGERKSSKGQTKEAKRNDGDTIQSKQSRKSVSQTVNDKQAGEEMSFSELKREEKRTSNDPADW